MKLEHLRADTERYERPLTLTLVGIGRDAKICFEGECSNVPMKKMLL